MNKLTWQDVVLVHRALREGEYRCEKEIFEREAELLNVRLAPTLSVSASRVDREQIARKLSGYDDATWSKLREDRKRTYRRAADSLITQWSEFVSLFEVKP